MPLNAKAMSAPSATEPFIDRYRRVTPKWYPWIKRMIDSLRQTVLTVNTIETNVGTIDTTVDLISADLNTVEITVAALEDTTVAQGLSISNTLTLVSGLTTDLGTVETNLSTLTSNLANTNSNLTTLDGEVSTLETSINGQLDTIDSQIAGIGGDIGAIHARWAVAINGNNQVVGLVRLDGGASGSQFSVVADKFVVAHPTAPGTTITAFVVGLVNGVSTVGINGNVLIDGSILARHISVGSLSALTANIGTVTAGIIQGTKAYHNLGTGEFYIDA